MMDKYRGCLIGGAAGDALGYTVEFLSYDSIVNKYGKNGITEYQLNNSVAQISDDTQMTLFTANGILLGAAQGITDEKINSYLSYISCCYMEWLQTQTKPFPLKEDTTYSWLSNIPELFALRAPGNTCISAINTFFNGTYGSIENPINSSKGCGGVMRVAPIGLYFKDKKYPAEETDRFAAQTAALTHGHELGYIPAAALVHIIRLISHNDDISLMNAVEDALLTVKTLFPNAKHMTEFINIMEKAIKLSRLDMNDIDAVQELGLGWVAEETLAIAVYCALKYENDFDKALITSVNHSGDSDSTGAVTGNILGAYLGLSRIPQKYKNNLELYNVILEIADDLYYNYEITEADFDQIRKQKYIYKNYKPL